MLRVDIGRQVPDLMVKGMTSAPVWMRVAWELPMRHPLSGAELVGSFKHSYSVNYPSVQKGTDQ